MRLAIGFIIIISGIGLLRKLLSQKEIFNSDVEGLAHGKGIIGAILGILLGLYLLIDHFIMG